jgi:hypothetical protein
LLACIIADRDELAGFPLLADAEEAKFEKADPSE